MSINAWGSDDPAEVAKGGTGASTLTDGGIVLGSGTSPVTVTSQPTNGQLLIGSTGVDPVLGSLTSTGATITITPGAGTINLESAGGGGGQPITDYVVDPGGGGSYTTIQSAINQANTDGGGSVWIRPGTYTEDLTLYSNVTLVGADATANTGGPAAIIVGTHTPPTSGYLEFRNIGFGDNAADVISSASAGTTEIRLENCQNGLTSGAYTLLALAAWTGPLTLIGCTMVGTGRLITNSSGGADIKLMYCSGLDVGSVTPIANTVQVNGDVFMQSCRNIDLIDTGGTTVIYESELYRYYNVNATAYVWNSSSLSFVLAGGGTAYFYNCSAYNGGAAPWGINDGSGAANAYLYNCVGVTGGASSSAAISISGSSSTAYLYNCVFQAGGSATYGIEYAGGTGGSVVLSDTTFLVQDRFQISSVSYAGAARGGGVGWAEVTGTSQQAVNNFGYVANNGSLVTITLPVYSEVGDILKVTGKGAGGWRVAQNAGQTINTGASTTTTGVTGRIDSSQRYAGVTLVCITADTAWNVIGSDGTFTVT